MNFLSHVGLAFLFAGPIFVSNATPAIFGGGFPIDAYKKFVDGGRLLGDHKTIVGFFVGVLSGFITGILVMFIIGDMLIANYSSIGFNLSIWTGLLMGFGANFGDLLGSFIKRRLNIESGGKFPGFDQFGYMIFGLLWSWFCFKAIPWQFLVSLLIIGPLMHIGVNIFAFSINAKDVPW